MMNSRFIRRSRMLGECRIGKQFRRARPSLNATGGQDGGRGGAGETGKGLEVHLGAEDEQPDKLFPQGGIHVRGGEGLYRGMESQ